MSELTSMMNIGKEMERKLISIGSRDIPPLKQTLDEVINEYNAGIILKILK